MKAPATQFRPRLSSETEAKWRAIQAHTRQSFTVLGDELANQYMKVHGIKLPEKRSRTRKAKAA
jgi:hypothetical protein